MTSRGNGKQKIFLDDRDRAVFLSMLASVVERHSWICFAYCLMNNHYHLLIETPNANLSEGMRNLNSAYSQGFNKKHDLVGHVMQGRYKSPLVKNDNHMLELTRYIVLNPVRSGLAREPGQWRWSSYCATAGLSPVPTFLRTDNILGLFSKDRDEARKAYIRFVNEGPLGGYSVEPDGRAELEELFQEANDTAARALAMREAHLMHGYTITEIANHLKVNCSTVSRTIMQSS
ncbi:MAG: transposase [Actinobacteria bacterium]|nr:transposase [Actinomycetota bacterium]